MERACFDQDSDIIEDVQKEDVEKEDVEIEKAWLQRAIRIVTVSESCGCFMRSCRRVSCATIAAKRRTSIARGGSPWFTVNNVSLVPKGRPG